MSLVRQSWIGMSLASLIIAAWALLHVAGIFFVTLDDPLMTVLMMAALTWLSAGLFILSHDAMHGSLCPAHQKTGDLTGRLALLLYAGYRLSQLRPKHQLHHRHPGSVDDPDFAVGSPGRALAWYRHFVLTYFGAREITFMAARIGIYFLLGAPIENILLFFAVPAILSSVQLFYFGTFLPHRHTDMPETAFADQYRARSNDVGYFISLLTCFHFGYHHEHHLHPGAPWWQLPAVRQKRAA